METKPWLLYVHSVCARIREVCLATRVHSGNRNVRHGARAALVNKGSLQLLQIPETSERINIARISLESILALWYVVVFRRPRSQDLRRRARDGVGC